MIYNNIKKLWRRSQVVKAEDCKSSIPRFESGRRLHARLAQWLERLLDMQEVAGSSPAPGTTC